MAREFSLVLRNQSPLGELFSLRAFDKQTANLIAAKFEPEHVVGEIQVEVVLVRVLLEELALGHQILSGILIHLAQMSCLAVHDLATHLAALLYFWWHGIVVQLFLVLRASC